MRGKNAQEAMCVERKARKTNDSRESGERDDRVFVERGIPEFVLLPSLLMY